MQRRAKHSVSSLHSISSSPPGSPTTNAKKASNKGHERSQSDCSAAQPVSLSAESSSVTSLPVVRKALVNPSGKLIFRLCLGTVSGTDLGRVRVRGM
jgi:hypothetical protein